MEQNSLNHGIDHRTARLRKRNIIAALAFIMLVTPGIWTVITFAVLARKTRTVNATCQAHMQTLGKAFLAYATHHQNTFPSSSNWAKSIQPYVTDVSAYRCPSDSTSGFTSYAMNDFLSGKKLSALKDPSHLILLYEPLKSGDSPHGNGKDIFNIGHDNGGQGRHNSSFYRFNFYLFADGHVTYPRALKDTEEYRWTNSPNPKTNIDAPDNPTQGSGMLF